METILIISSILLWVAVLLNLLLTLGLARRIRSAFPRMESLKAGQKAPGFSAQTLQGKVVTLNDYEGKATAFIFVSPDCKPCREELPGIQRVWLDARQFGTELVLVSDADEEKTRPLIDGLADGLPVLVAPREHNPFFTDYKAMGTPSYCLIDAQGRVQAAGMGVSELVEKFEALSQTAKGGDGM